MDERNQIFQRLKPSCVGLSQAALTLTGSNPDIPSIIAHLEDIQNVLVSVRNKHGVLDVKLADYIFFPLSQILRSSQKLSIRCLELCLECIALLIEKGWSRHLSPQLAAQLVILSTLLADSKPKGFLFTQSTDELQTAAFSCLYHIFDAISRNDNAIAVFINDANFPQLGQTISTVLDGILLGESSGLQTTATDALVTLTGHILNRELCASFLPGIMSKLTKIVTPSTSQRRNNRVLIGCLQTTAVLIRKTMAKEIADSPEQSNTKSSTSIIDQEWLQTAQIQLKLALTSMFRVQENSRTDVKDSLAKLCLDLLRYCDQNLDNCTQPALETLISITTEVGEGEIMQALQDLLRTYPRMATLCQTTLFDWQQSLPTVMQAADEQLKVRKLQQMTTLYELLVNTNAEISTLERSLTSALRDSVTLTLKDSSKTSTTAMPSTVQSLDLAVQQDSVNGNTKFSQALSLTTGQSHVLDAIKSFVTILTRSANSTSTSEWCRALQISSGEAQLANFWLLLTSMTTTQERENAIDDFLDYGTDVSVSVDTTLEETYAFALATLTNPSEETPDPRLLSLSLRAVSLRAQHAGVEFRYELVDALYPILHTLATPDEVLQQDSITTLNILRTACGYTSVQELIVDNADYLTNAVALKLNAFDVSPQAPLVLLMMVRLAGSSLLPYLEDTVESIFAALEDFHGYPMLVELLFKVLSVMADEGSKAPQLTITSKPSLEVESVLHEKWKPISMAELARSIADELKEQREKDDMPEEVRETAPQQPWKDIEGEKTTNDEAGDLANPDEKQVEEIDDPPPAPRLYSLLLKMTELTQHFLPSASASLRTSLLSLIQTTIPAIAQHENSFLPLINTLWPEITSRLEDDEPYIQASALNTMTLLCEHAGDFMRGRIVELWPLIRELHTRLTSEILAAQPSRSKPTRSFHDRSNNNTSLVLSDPLVQQAIAKFDQRPEDWSNTTLRLVWNALNTSLITIADKVYLPPDLFEDAVDLLTPMLVDVRVRTVLESHDPDTVWLKRLRAGQISLPELPESLGIRGDGSRRAWAV